MLLNEVYFWTDTINGWNHLLESKEYKLIIINSWRYLVKLKNIRIYAFVIMPNHLHIVWEMLALNKKEMPYASFNKFTAHQFLAQLKSEKLRSFKEGGTERNHRFWKRDALAIHLDSRAKVEQKINYIHLNPLQEHWNLVKYPEEYNWSSARFYENGVDEYGILTHYMDRF